MAKREQLFTPIGVFKYCHLNKPDTRYKEEGEFSVNVLLDKEDPAVKKLMKDLDRKAKLAAEEAQEKFDEANGQQKAKWKKKGITEPTINPWYEEEYDDEGDPTGNIILKMKTKAQFQDRKSGRMIDKVVKLVDGRGQVIPAKKRPLVYGGTMGRVAFAVGNVFIPKDADCYLSFYLNEVQITKLVSAGSGTSSFGAVEDSDFDADELEEYEGNAADDDVNDDDQDDSNDDDDEIPF
jgi:hypothetical protein